MKNSRNKQVQLKFNFLIKNYWFISNQKSSKLKAESRKNQIQIKDNTNLLCREKDAKINSKNFEFYKADNNESFNSSISNFSDDMLIFAESLIILEKVEERLEKIKKIVKLSSNKEKILKEKLNEYYSTKDYYKKESNKIEIEILVKEIKEKQKIKREKEEIEKEKERKFFMQNAPIISDNGYIISNSQPSLPNVSFSSGQNLRNANPTFGQQIVYPSSNQIHQISNISSVTPFSQQLSHHSTPQVQYVNVPEMNMMNYNNCFQNNYSQLNANSNSISPPIQENIYSQYSNYNQQRFNNCFNSLFNVFNNNN